MDDAIIAADKVEAAQGSHSAIVGHTFIRGVGHVSLFSDHEARSAWIDHVGPLKRQGLFTALSSAGNAIDVTWGVR